jgi:hypothetical protein
MLFSTEAELVQQLHASLAPILAPQVPAVSTFLEASVGRFVADLVLVSGIPESRFAQMKPFSAFEAVLVASLRQAGPTRIDLLEKNLLRPRGSLRVGALEALQRTDVVRRERGGRVCLAPDWPPDIQVIAIEAKLKRWRDALSQASSYSSFADQVFVALPQPYADLAEKNSAQFEDLGVGILSVSTSSVEVALEAGHQSVHDWKRDFLLSRFLARA